MSSKTQRVTGWVLTGLVGLFMIGASGVPKFFDFPGKNEMMDKLGIPLSLLPALAILEIAVAVIYLIPRTSFLGAILMTGILGGAVFTHLRVGDPWYFPIIVGVLAWLGLALRQPTIFALTKMAQVGLAKSHRFGRCSIAYCSGLTSAFSQASRAVAPRAQEVKGTGVVQTDSRPLLFTLGSFLSECI